MNQRADRLLSIRLARERRPLHCFSGGKDDALIERFAGLNLFKRMDLPDGIVVMASFLASPPTIISNPRSSRYRQLCPPSTGTLGISCLERDMPKIRSGLSKSIKLKSLFALNNVLLRMAGPSVNRIIDNCCRGLKLSRQHSAWRGTTSVTGIRWLLRGLVKNTLALLPACYTFNRHRKLTMPRRENLAREIERPDLGRVAAAHVQAFELKASARVLLHVLNTL